MDGIIIGILILIIFIALRSSIKHFAGQGGCCGGSSYKTKKKKLHNVIDKRSFKVEGMHCENCRNRVEETINDISGAAGTVNLKKGILTVAYEKDIEDESIIEELSKKGYEASRII